VIPLDLITQLRATQDPTQVLNLAQAKLKLLDTSLITEIVDNQREVSDLSVLIFL
jgi:hypothetical protein